MVLKAGLPTRGLGSWEPISCAGVSSNCFAGAGVTCVVCKTRALYRPNSQKQSLSATYEGFQDLSVNSALKSTSDESVSPSFHHYSESITNNSCH